MKIMNGVPDGKEYWIFRQTEDENGFSFGSAKWVIKYMSQKESRKEI